MTLIYVVFLTPHDSSTCSQLSEDKSDPYFITLELFIILDGVRREQEFYWNKGSHGESMQREQSTEEHVT